jgi:hypothetical protein
MSSLSDLKPAYRIFIRPCSRERGVRIITRSFNPCPRIPHLCEPLDLIVCQRFTFSRNAYKSYIGYLPNVSGPCHNSVMANQYPAPPINIPIYRLVVRVASVQKTKQFGWEIRDDTHSERFVQASERTFRSMEEAYNDGRGALEHWQQKVRKIYNASIQIRAHHN